MNKLLKVGIISILTIFALVIVIIGVILFNMFNSSPMSQERVENCFERNYEFLSVVAEYLITINYNGLIEINYFGYTSPRLRGLVWDTWTEIGYVEEPLVAEAIRQLKGQGYDRISKDGNTVRFRRDLWHESSVLPRGRRTTSRSSIFH